MKRIALLIFLLSGLLVTMSYADRDKKAEHHGYGLETKFFQKVHLAFKNQEELGLSDKQYEKIRTLKMDTKKDLIKRKAEIDTIAVDIKSKLWGDSIDKESIYKLIDQKYELKKARAKAIIDACDTFKNILTDEQKKKLREISSQRYSK